MHSTCSKYEEWRQCTRWHVFIIITLHNAPLSKYVAILEFRPRSTEENMRPMCRSQQSALGKSTWSSLQHTLCELQGFWAMRKVRKGYVAYERTYTPDTYYILLSCMCWPVPRVDTNSPSMCKVSLMGVACIHMSYYCKYST